MNLQILFITYASMLTVAGVISAISLACNYTTWSRRNERRLTRLFLIILLASMLFSPILWGLGAAQ